MRECADCVNAQADLNLRWMPMSEGTFSDVGDTFACAHSDKKSTYASSKYKHSKIPLLRPLENKTTPLLRPA